MRRIVLMVLAKEIDYMISDYAKPQNIEYFNQKHWLQI